jgi:RHS repeat-associated protein
VSYSYQGDKAVTYTKPTSYRVDYTFDYLGNRTRDNDTEYSSCSNPDQRDFYYDGRNNLVNVTSRYFLGGSTWHPYTVSYAYDEKDRMVFKSFVDDTTGDEAQWFFYWDLYDRLIQVKHVPDIGDQDTYSVFQWYWLETRPFLYYQIDYPSATTTRRYLASDEQNRPLAAWSWPSSGDTARVWEVDPGLFGWDEVKVGTGVYQPIRFPGQLYDDDTESYSTTTYCVSAFLKRPGVAYNHHRSYDSFTGTYLQVDPKVDDTWEPYTYVGQDPVMLMDVAGTSMSELSFGGSPTTRGGTEAPYDIVYDLVTESGDPDRGSCANAARGATRHVFMVVWGIRTEGRARMPLGAPPGMCSWWSGGRDWRYLQRNSR